MADQNDHAILMDELSLQKRDHDISVWKAHRQGLDVMVPPEDKIVLENALQKQGNLTYSLLIEDIQE